MQKSKIMANFDGDMNIEAQLQVAYSTNAELRDQIDVLNKTIWSLEERLRISDESRGELMLFYENQMDALRSDQQKLIDAAVAQITKSFEEQIAKLIAERDAALLSAKQWRGKKFGRGSERNAGHEDDVNGGAGENREAEKADFVNPEVQAKKDAEKTSATTADGETVDVEKEVAKLKRRHPGAEVSVERVDYSKVCKYMSDENVFMHPLEEYFVLGEGERFRTTKNGEIEKSYYRIIIRYPERYEQHIYEAARVRSKDKDEYKTTDVLEEMRRPIKTCIFGTEILSYILCEKYVYHTPFRQIVRKLKHHDLNISKEVLEDNVHKAIDWMSEKLREVWMNQVRKSWIWMIDETRTLVGCTDEETNERRYKNKYMWGIRANSVNLAWFIYENGSRGAAAIRPFLDGFLGFYTTDGYAVYKIFDSKSSADKGKKGRRVACLVHIRRGFVDALIENRSEAMWFIEEFGKMFSVEHYCMKHGLKGVARLVERLKKGNTADIMSRIEERLEVFRQSDYAGCGEMLTKALKYASSEWPAMKRVLECGDVELSNNLSEQMMRSIKMNLKNAGNIGSERAAKNNAFMFSVIESCKMCGRSVESYLRGLLDRLKMSKDGDDMTCCLPCFMPA